MTGSMVKCTHSELTSIVVSVPVVPGFWQVLFCDCRVCVASWIVTTTSCANVPGWNSAADVPLVTSVGVVDVVDTTCVTQADLFVRLSQFHPCSMRTLMGRVRPSGNGMSPLVATFFGLALGTMKTSANAIILLPTSTWIRKMSPGSTPGDLVSQLTM